MIKQQTHIKRWLAVALSAMMLMGLMAPLSVLAEDAIPEAKDKTILAFAQLDERVSKQAVPIGTALAGLALPKALSATVESPGTPPDAPSAGTENLAVTWQSTPEYLGDAVAGDFTFIPQFSKGYALGEGVIVPQIVVTVEDAPAAVTITGFPEQEEISAKRTVPFDTPLASLSLPETIKASTDAGLVSVAVTWQAVTEYIQNMGAGHPSC